MTEPLKIVIVEDDALIAMDMAELLMELGHEICVIACTEAQAVAAGLRFKPDLMIVDGNLAEGSGVAAMAQIQEHIVIPHLYITGDPQQILQKAPGAVVLTKPFTMHRLADGIARARSVAVSTPKTAM